MNDRDITVTVPLIASVLSRTANYFNELAAEVLAHDPDLVPVNTGAPEWLPVAADGDENQPAVAEVPVFVTTETVWDATELDGENRPHDPRIHGRAKNKLSKKPHGWKLQRGMAKDSPALVKQVHAEMAAAGYGPNAQPPAPVAPVPPVAVPPAPVAPVTPADVMEYMSARTTDLDHGIDFVTAIPSIIAPYGFKTVAEVNDESAAQIYDAFELKWAELTAA